MASLLDFARTFTPVGDALRPRQGTPATPRGWAITFTIVLALAGLGMTGATHAQSALRETLFAEAARALSAANEARASLLAPTSYSEASERYRRAEDLLKDGGNLESIQRNLDAAAKSFTRSANAARIAKNSFEGGLQARAAAEEAKAKVHAADDWQAGELALAEAAKRLEAGREKSALDYADRAEESFRAAELVAIKASFLSETDELLKQADKLRANRYAPKTFTNAKSLLALAEQRLEEDRYDTDRPRNLARQAKHEAYHAIYLARLGKDLRSGDTTNEDVVLQWEASLSRLADVLDTPIYFDNGETAAVNTLISKVNDINALVERLAQDLGEREQQVIALRTQVAQLNDKLGGEAAAVQSLNALLERQQEHRERFSQVENSYLVTEAEVLRQGNGVILRMVGLNFDSGTADIKPAHTELLRKLQGSADVFPRSRLTIEGHTDSYGSDAANLELSEKRAQAIKDYLIQETGMDALRISARGYGEARPVANNETAEGRARNRRIDIIITPFDDQ